MPAILQALKLAQERGLLPTNLSAAELQEMTQRLAERVFFSARTTNAWYVERLKGLVERYVTGEGRDNDLAQLRVEARDLLARAGYTPEKGFPGDEELGIPPAKPGSLRDLSSEKRLNTIFETQAGMMRGLGLKLRGLTRLDTYPAYELVRIGSRRMPREWLERWNEAADNVNNEGVAQGQGLTMMALKTSPVWRALGSSALFDDGLNVDHPPFAFGSGMGWREVPAAEATEAGLELPPGTTMDLKEAVPSEAQRQQTQRDQIEDPQARAAKLAKYQKLKARFDAMS